jgi:dTDP-4-amino-4,6-dideoxy-D-galactose acyltransferase
MAVTGWEPRPWDSDFFGTRIARVTAPRVTGAGLSHIVRDATAASIQCLYLLSDADDDETVRAAEGSGFSLVDVRLTLECAIRGRSGPDIPGTPKGAPYAVIDEGAPSAATDADGLSVVRAARVDDLPALMALARVSHRNTRFHRDRHFDPARSDELYAVWIERSVRGELADVVWVVDVDSGARGYLTMSRDAASATIGLVAVDEAYRGRGYGDQLLRTALQWAADQNLPRVSVVTQGHSAAAVRFYERAGFITRRVEFWYHGWL